jgi:anaerobic selenocysteine-containing dehydrogenase
VEEERLSYCRICAAACGTVVTIDRERVLRVRGDAEHPVSRGYTCSKGRSLAARHHSPTRLDRPRLRGAEVGWDDLLDDLSHELRRHRRRSVFSIRIGAARSSSRRFRRMRRLSRLSRNSASSRVGSRRSSAGCTARGVRRDLGLATSVVPADGVAVLAARLGIA